MLDVVCLNESSVYVEWYPLHEDFIQRVHLEYWCFNTSSGVNIQVNEVCVLIFQTPSLFYCYLTDYECSSPTS